MVAGPSDMFGELSIFDPGPAHVDRRRRSPRSAPTRWTAPRCASGSASAPRSPSSCCGCSPARLRRTNNMLADLIFTDVPGRVAKALLQLARQFGSQESGLLRVTHDLTQEEIAQLVGASPRDGEQGARRLRPPRLAAAGGQERADPGAGAPGPPGPLDLASGAPPRRVPLRSDGANNWYAVPECVTLDGMSSSSSLADYRAALTAPGACCRRCSLGRRPPARGDDRAGDAALRAGRDGLVRRRRAGVGRLARGVASARSCRAG